MSTLNNMPGDCCCDGPLCWQYTEPSYTHDTDTSGSFVLSPITPGRARVSMPWYLRSNGATYRFGFQTTGGDQIYLEVATHARQITPSISLTEFWYDTSIKINDGGTVTTLTGPTTSANGYCSWLDLDRALPYQGFNFGSGDVYDYWGGRLDLWFDADRGSFAFIADPLWTAANNPPHARMFRPDRSTPLYDHTTAISYSGDLNDFTAFFAEWENSEDTSFEFSRSGFAAGETRVEISCKWDYDGEQPIPPNNVQSPTLCRSGLSITQVETAPFLWDVDITDVVDGAGESPDNPYSNCSTNLFDIYTPWNQYIAEFSDLFNDSRRMIPYYDEDRTDKWWIWAEAAQVATVIIDRTVAKYWYYGNRYECDNLWIDARRHLWIEETDTTIKYVMYLRAYVQDTSDTTDSLWYEQGVFESVESPKNDPRTITAYDLPFVCQGTTHTGGRRIFDFSGATVEITSVE